MASQSSDSLEIRCPECTTQVSADAEGTVPDRCSHCGAVILTHSPASAPAAATEEQPSAPDGYQILSVLGKGGMGIVVRAREIATGKVVALKYLLISTGNLRERFLREGRLLCQLRHPNIVSGYSIQFVDDYPVMVFELVEGGDLKGLLAKDGPLPVPRVLQLAGNILDGLEYAHRAGVVHRDLKTANVLLTSDGTAKLADFGIARMREAQEQLTRTGAVMGTPTFMAPEQATGARVDARADLYAVGVMLFKMLSGRYPIHGDNAGQLLARIVTEPPTPLETLVPNIDPNVAQVVNRCLEKQPDRRFPSAAELLASLRGERPPPRPRATAKYAVVATDSDSTIPDQAMPESPVAGRPAGSPVDQSGPIRARSRPSRTISRPQSLRITAVAPPPRRFPWIPSLIVLVVGIGGALLAPWHHRAAPGVPVAALPSGPVDRVPDPDYLVREGTQLAVKVRLGHGAEIRATLENADGHQPLVPLTNSVDSRVWVFAVPLDTALKPFTVRLETTSGIPVEGEPVESPGLLPLFNLWHSRFYGTEQSSPEDNGPPVFAHMLQVLANTVIPKYPPKTFEKYSDGHWRRDLESTKSQLLALLHGAVGPTAPLLVAAPFLLDDRSLSLKQRLAVYEVLLPMRILERCLASMNLEPMEAHSSQGDTFRVGAPAPGATADTLDQVGSGINLLAPGALNSEVDKVNTINDLLPQGNGRPPDAKPDPSRPQETRTVVLRCAVPTVPFIPRLDFKCELVTGNQDPFPVQDLLWIRTDACSTYLLADPACPLGPPEEAGSRWYAVRFDPGMLHASNRFKLVRTFVCSDTKIDHLFSKLRIHAVRLMAEYPAGHR